MTYVKHIVKRGTKLDHFQAAFCVSPFFSPPTPFLHESHCLRWSSISTRREKHSENSVSSFHYLCPATSSSPVIEQLVKTIVTPWSGIIWAYYVGCTVDVITTVALYIRFRFCYYKNELFIALNDLAFFSYLLFLY